MVSWFNSLLCSFVSLLLEDTIVLFPSPPHASVFSCVDQSSSEIVSWIFWKNQFWIFFFLFFFISKLSLYTISDFLFFFSCFLNSLFLSNFWSAILSLRGTHPLSPWEFFLFIWGDSSGILTRQCFAKLWASSPVSLNCLVGPLRVWMPHLPLVLAGDGGVRQPHPFHSAIHAVSLPVQLL